ncbi:MAG: aldo/keto reductase [Chloroflexota bacterium]
MKYGDLSHRGRRVSRLILGSLAFSVDDPATTNALLDRFFEAGGTAVDTARVYGRGASEIALGRWIRERHARDRIVLISKGAHHDLSTLASRVNQDAIQADLQTSLDALQVDTIDFYLLHRDQPELPVGPIVDALNDLSTRGVIDAFGGSNWSHQRLDQANAYARARGLTPMTVSSPNLALAVPNEPVFPGCLSVSGDAEALAWYARTRMPLLAWSSQARGFFSGRFSPDRRDGDANVIRVYYSDANWERARRAGQLARDRGRSLSQIALAWVLHQPLDIYALVGPRTVAELDDCLAALDVELSPAEQAWLNLEQGAPKPA